MFWLTTAIGVGVVTLLLTLGPRLVGAQGRQSMAMAVRSLLLHKLRAFLSVLGIIIGTASVIVLMAFGEGSMRDALEDIKRQGATNIIVLSVKPPEKPLDVQRESRIARYGLTREDLERFQETLRPTVVGTLPLRVFTSDIRSLNQSGAFHGRVVATQPRYATLYHLERHLAVGRFLAEQDERQTANVAVLGSDVARELFPGADPLVKTITINGGAFEVVGVLKDRLPSTGGASVEKFNGDVYIPLRSWRERVGQTVVLMHTADSYSAEVVPLSEIILTVGSTEQVRSTAAIVRSQLERFHDRVDYELKVPLDRLEEAERTRDRYRVLLFFIAGISLLVGGIGIMNIMLATVTERTREIGIRRALGARRGDITFQFLVEAIVQTTLGGLSGVASGLALIYAIPQVFRSWQTQVLHVSHAQLQSLPVQVHVPSIFLAFFVAIAVGVLFGWYPSRRAALLDPIQALRHE